MKKILFALLFAAVALKAYAASISLQSYAGQWVSAQGGGGQSVCANSGGIGGWEIFTLTDLNGGALESGDAVVIQAGNGQYFCAEGGGGQNVVANRDAIGGWEVFTILKQNGGGSINSGDAVAFQACNGQYLCAEGGGGDVVNANRDWINGWETFTFVTDGANTGGGAGTPQVSFSPSATSVQPGQTVYFNVSVSCSGGLNEIGLEGCDPNGNPAVNLGAVGASGTSASYTFSWQAPGPGTYYFDAYGWNVDRSQLTRAAVISITVAETPVAPGTPQVTFSPSSTSVQPGQTVNFSVSANCSGGLNEIGLEGCDTNGNPVANLGAVGVGGTSAGSTFSWQAPGAGTYYFDAYGWNVDRSQLTRTAVIVVTVADDPGTAAAAPQVSMSASSTSIHPGQGVDFNVFASCSSGLSEIGFEECDASGKPLSSAGAVGVTGTSASNLFSWATPEKADYFDSSSYSFWASAPGTYYFSAYAWNAECSQRTRTAIIAITVTTAINTLFEGWVCQSYGAPLEQTAWYAFDARTEGGIYFYGAMPDVPAPSDDWGDFLGIMELIESERNERDQRIDAEIGAAQRAQLNEQINKILASGKGVQFVDEFGNIVGTKPPASSGLPASGWVPPEGPGTSWNGWTSKTVYQNSSGAPEGEIIRLPAFIVNGNNPETFDWNGYFAWYNRNNIPVPAIRPVPSGSGAPPTGNTTNARDAYPYAQQKVSSCSVAAVRNALKELGITPVPSEAVLRKQMADAAGIPESQFDDPTAGLNRKLEHAINTVFGLYGYKVTVPDIVGVTGTPADPRFISLDTAVRGAEKGIVLIGHTPTTVTFDYSNHIVMVQFNSATGQARLVDSGVQDNRYAKVSTLADITALSQKIASSNFSLGYQTTHVYVVTKK